MLKFVNTVFVFEGMWLVIAFVFRILHSLFSYLWMCIRVCWWVYEQWSVFKFKIACPVMFVSCWWIFHRNYLPAWLTLPVFTWCDWCDWSSKCRLQYVVLQYQIELIGLTIVVILHSIVSLIGSFLSTVPILDDPYKNLFCSFCFPFCIWTLNSISLFCHQMAILVLFILCL